MSTTYMIYYSFHIFEDKSIVYLKVWVLTVDVSKAKDNHVKKIYIQFDSQTLHNH